MLKTCREMDVVILLLQSGALTKQICIVCSHHYSSWIVYSSSLSRVRCFPHITSLHIPILATPPETKHLSPHHLIYWYHMTNLYPPLDTTWPIIIHLLIPHDQSLSTSWYHMTNHYPPLDTTWPIIVHLLIPHDQSLSTSWCNISK